MKRDGYGEQDLAHIIKKYPKQQKIQKKHGPLYEMAGAFFFDCQRCQLYQTGSTHHPLVMFGDALPAEKEAALRAARCRFAVLVVETTLS
jgi:hypothetical protein